MCRQDELLNWYDSNRRVLPWREDPTPYHIWISEIMLQQTRVEVGKAYYLRFIHKLPDIASLSRASEDVYMKLWEGLGYYSRVRNLHKAAVIIMERYAGKMPETEEELQKLPGIGPYTASAIASIAFGKKTVSVDGNLIRVFARMTEYKENAKDIAAKKDAQKYFAAIQPADRPGDFNQALMDLGATVCLPNGTPLCGKCPWKRECQAHIDGEEILYPKMPEKKARKTENRTILLVHKGKEIVIRKRPDKGLLAGLYEFPNLKGHLDSSDVLACVKKMGISEDQIQGRPEYLGEANHIFTHIEWHMIGYSVMIDPSTVLKKPWIVATPEDLRTKYTVPSAFKAFVRKAEQSLPVQASSGTRNKNPVNDLPE